MLGNRIRLQSVDYPQTLNAQRFSLTGAEVCPTHDPATGLPLIIDYIVLECRPTGSVAGTAVAGEDVVRCARDVRLTQIDLVERVPGLHGDQLRAFAFEQCGPTGVEEHAGWAIAAIPAGTVVQIPIHLGVPMAFAEDDTALMAAGIKTLSWQGVTTGVDGPCVAGGTLTFTSATWRIVVYARRVSYIVNGPTCTLETFTMGSQKDFRLELGQAGGIPAAMLLHRQGAAGGLTMAALTSVSIDEDGRQPWALDDLGRHYRRDRNLTAGTLAQGTTGSPVWDDPLSIAGTAAGGVVPLVYATKDQHSFGRPLRSVQIRTLPAGAYTDLTVLVRRLNPRHDALGDRLAQIYGPIGEWRTKTEGKTRRELGPWGWRGSYLPLKASVLGADRVAA